MSPDPQLPSFVRSVADINDDIRALWAGAGSTLTTEERRRYSELLVEYAAAVRARIVPAA